MTTANQPALSLVHSDGCHLAVACEGRALLYDFQSQRTLQPSQMGSAASLLSRIAASVLSKFGTPTLAQEAQLGGLPLEVVALVFLCLPVDARLRAREVSRGWRALLNEPRFWLVLDFSRGSGVVARITRALLFAAGERGRGHLHTLDLTGVRSLLNEDLAQFVAVHGQSLRSVTAPEEPHFSADEVTRLCRSAPLCTLRCYVWCSAAEALPLLRCEAPCTLLHIFKLGVHTFNDEQAVLDLAAALPSHSGKIKFFTVDYAPLRNVAVADALMRGISEARVSDVTFYSCRIAPASLPGLTRLLQAGCLERLDIYNTETALFEEGPNLTAFCHALRSSSLQALRLRWCQLWRDPAAAGELLASLVGHPTLRELSLCANRVDNTVVARRTAGEQLTSLITHNSALQKLDLDECILGDAGLAPIFEALPRFSTLKELHFSYETISREFARDVILPAVRANSSLRTLSFGQYCVLPELLEAQAIVAARMQPDAGAIAAA